MSVKSPLRWHGSLAIPIPGFAGYFATTSGKLLSFRQTKIRELRPDLRPSDSRKRYTLKSNSGIYVRKYGSYFVLITFVGDRPEGMEACHQDGDCKNDSPFNLRWDTAAANKADMVRHGTQPRGEKHSKAKLTDSQAREIIRRRQSGEPGRSLAEEFGVSQAAISFIYRGKRKSCLK